jgi:ribosomal protein S18 acetylase RimI-like enzyme
MHGKISGMLPDLRLRYLGRDEWQVLRDMRLNALSDSPQSFLAKYDREEQYGPERWKAEFDRGQWIVGELGGSHICLTGVTHEVGTPADERYLEYVWVAQDFRRRAVAVDMLTHTIAGLKKSGIRTVFLWILNGNDPAWRLYTKHLDFFTTHVQQSLQDDPGRYEERLRRDLI